MTLPQRACTVRKAEYPISSLCGVNKNSLIVCLPKWRLREIAGVLTAPGEVWLIMNTSFHGWLLSWLLSHSPTPPHHNLGIPLLSPPLSTSVHLSSSSPAIDKGRSTTQGKPDHFWNGQNKKKLLLFLPLSTPGRIQHFLTGAPQEQETWTAGQHCNSSCTCLQIQHDFFPQGYCEGPKKQTIPYKT